MIARPPPGRRPNVVVIVLDAARAKNLSVAGGRRVARTPNLETLATHGTRFLRAVAPGNWTVPSHMSMLTGTYPSQHGLRTFRRGAARLPTIAGWLSAQGYQTGVFSEAVHLVGGYGLEDGYAERCAWRAGMTDEERTFANRVAPYTRFLYGASARRVFSAIPPAVFAVSAFNYPQEVAFKRDVTAPYLLPAFERWLEQRDRDRPFHALVNFVEAHEPYPEIESDPTVGAGARRFARTPRFFLLSVDGLQRHVPWAALEGAYLRGIERADAKLGDVIGAIERAGEADRTLVIATSDHGQSFGEGGNVYHGCGATDSIARVPTVVRAPMYPELPAMVDRWTTICDLASWIKAVVVGRAPYDEDGFATTPFPVSPPDAGIVFCEGGPASDPNRSLAGVGRTHPWNHRLVAAYSGDEKWVLDLATGAIRHWVGAADFDASAGDPLEREEAARIRRRVFDRYEHAPGSEEVAAFADADRPALAGARMRSWGYD